MKTTQGVSQRLFARVDTLESGMDPKNDPVVKFARKRIAELSAKHNIKTDGRKVHEFAGRDQYGRYVDDDRGGPGRAATGVAGAGALGAAGLYARGRFAGAGRLRGKAGGVVAPRTSGLGGIYDTMRLGGKNLAGDVGKLAGAAGAATTSGKAMIASLLRRITLRGRAG